MSNFPKVSIDALPMVTSPELRFLRDAIEQQLRKLENYVNTRSFPVGVIVGNPTNTVWDGFLVCDGSAFDTVKYRDLYDYLGSGNLPDYRGMTLVGRDAGQTEFDTIGETGGSKAGITSHTHTGTTGAEDTNHGHNALSGGLHFHSANLANLNWTSNTVHNHMGHPGYATEGAEPNNGIPIPVPVNVDSAGAHTHTTDGASAAHGHGFTTASTGTDAGNLQPYKVVNWMIKT